jgi:hypothetical protein
VTNFVDHSSRSYACRAPPPRRAAAAAAASHRPPPHCHYPPARGHDTAKAAQAGYLSNGDQHFAPMAAAPNVQILGLPFSPNVGPSMMLVVDKDIGALKPVDLMKGEHMTEEFLALNPWHQ